MQPAGFLVRALADLIDLFLWALSFSIIILVLSDSQTLAQFVFGFLVYLVVVGLPLAILMILYRPFFTHYFGGNIGKLLVGLKVTDLNGHLLSFKRALFRYTIAYSFSGVMLGLGFLSIITDKEKRGFHDKAIGSKVVMTKTIWPLGLAILLVLLTTHFILWGNILQKIGSGPLRSEFGYLMFNFGQEMEKIDKNQSPSPSPMSQTTDTDFDNQLNHIYDLIDQKQYSQAQTKAGELAKITQQPKLKARVLVTQADIARTQIDDQSAEKYAIKALAIDPSSIEALDSLSELAYDQKDYNSALVYAQTAVKINPLSANSHNDYGLALEKLGRISEAITELKKAADLNPTSQVIQQNLKNIEQAR